VKVLNRVSLVDAEIQAAFVVSAFLHFFTRTNEALGQVVVVV
jgi:hypothetical protein